VVLIRLFVYIWVYCGKFYLPTSWSMVMYVRGVQLFAGSGTWSRSSGAGGDAGRSAAAHHAAHGHQAAHRQSVAAPASSISAHATTSPISASMNRSRIRRAGHSLRGGGQGLPGLSQFRSGIHQIRGKCTAQIATMRIIRETMLRLSIRQGSTVVTCVWVGCVRCMLVFVGVCI